MRGEPIVARPLMRQAAKNGRSVSRWEFPPDSDYPRAIRRLF